MIRRSTLSILVVFILLLAGTWFWQRQKKQTAASITPTPNQQQTLLGADTKINLLHLSGSDGKMVEVQRIANGEWQLNWPESKQTDTNAVDNAVSQLLTLQVLSTLEQTPSFEATGLVTPTYTIMIKSDTGNPTTITVGKPTPTGTGYYVLSSNGKLVVVEKNGMDMVLSLLANPPIPPTRMPTIPATSETTPVGSTLEPASTQAQEITPTP